MTATGTPMTRYIVNLIMYTPYKHTSYTNKRHCSQNKHYLG